MPVLEEQWAEFFVELDLRVGPWYGHSYASTVLLWANPDLGVPPYDPEEWKQLTVGDPDPSEPNLDAAIGQWGMAWPDPPSSTLVAQHNDVASWILTLDPQMRTISEALGRPGLTPAWTATFAAAEADWAWVRNELDAYYGWVSALTRRRRRAGLL